MKTMAFELWPPQTPPVALRRIDNIIPASPSASKCKQTTNPTSNAPSENLRPRSAEERFKRLQQATMERNKMILAALEHAQPPRKCSKRSFEGSQRLQRTYHDLNEGVLGCKHYATNVAVAAPCCDQFYACRFCHDEDNPNHTINRKTVNTLNCMRCGNVQEFTENQEKDRHCSKCNTDFARYFCDVCRFYDDSSEKEIFHCQECGVCRVGQAKDFFHCKGCNACLSINLKNNHKCVERAFEASCPVCACDLQDSVQNVNIFECGHAMHEACFKEYRKRNYRCPTCSKSIGDVREYFAEIDRIMEKSQMPAQYANMLAKITCADCEKRSTVRFHFMYHKCAHCASYNTNVLDRTRL